MGLLLRAHGGRSARARRAGSSSRRALRVALAFALAAIAWALAWLAVGCQPALPAGSSAGGAEVEEDAGPDVALRLEPDASADAAPAIVRLHVDALSDPAAAFLVHGTVGPTQLRELAEGAPSHALEERLVPVVAWGETATDAGADAAISEVVLSPAEPLVAGERYTVAIADPRSTFPLRVAEDDALPLLARVWPPLDGGTTSFAVFCGEVPLPDVAVPVALAPHGPSGVLRRGAAAGIGARCVRFEAAEDVADASPRVPPPLVHLGDRDARLDTRPLVAAEPVATPPLVCDEGEIAFGPGCARVEDDRLAARSPDAPLLWAIAGAGLDVVRATPAGQPFVVAPLPPSSDVALTVVTYDASGRATTTEVAATTLAPRPHLVLNEAMANPLGPEPAEEWVEIVNDGLVTADLGAFTIEDLGAATPLPSVPLAPGAFALLVNDGFVEDDGIDPPPAPGTLVVRVGKLGKGGLANDGELLRLRDAQGAIVSSFPPLPKPKPGASVARTDPTAPDAVAGSFVVASPTPGAPNAP